MTTTINKNAGTVRVLKPSVLPGFENIDQAHIELANRIAERLPASMTRRNLIPAFIDYRITHVMGMTFLIAPLDTARIGDHKPYTGEIVHQLSTDLGGIPTYLSNSTGIRYVFLLSKLPAMPHNVALPPDLPSGKFGVGVRFNGEPIGTAWESTPHMAVLGMTGSGKSVFLRSLAYQALKNDMRLMLADMDQTTFPMLAGHANLLSPVATSPAEALELVRQAVGECDTRAGLYKAMPGAPEKIGEYNALAVKNGQPVLPRILVILDEASAIFAASGGGKGEIARALSSLGWRGRKFGLGFIFAAQEFTRDLVGPVRDQVALSVCFRIRSGEMARRMGCGGAQRIPEERPGLAITDRYGPVQTYFVDKSLLGRGTDSALLSSPLTEQERALFQRALLDTHGCLSLAKIQEWGGDSVGPYRARVLQERWALRGWIAKDPERGNVFSLTESGRTLISSERSANQQTPATPIKPDSKPSNPDGKPE
jgi:hypothetical protein